MIRGRFRCCTFYRNVIGAIVGTIFITIYIKNDKSDKQMIWTKMINKANKYISFEGTKQFEVFNETDLQHWIAVSNNQEIILNQDLYGPITDDILILVIYVHEFTDNLKYLIASLSQLGGIRDTLLIFSHSYFDRNVNRLIKSIDFCRTLQVFYPYSIQAHPNKFPGYEKEDCPRDMDVKTAENINCTSAWFPDIHGRYRDPVESEKKLHWWWTANKVFENLSCTVDHKGIVLFLENNFFFIKDFIYVIDHMKVIAESLPQCDILSLGTNLAQKSYNSTFHIELTTWDPKYHSYVMAMDVSVWNSIASHYDLFCLIDDSSWARSLLHVSLNRKDGKRFKVLSSVFPRALPTSTCSFIGNVMNSAVIKSVFQILYMQKKYINSWFPAYFEVYTNVEVEDDEFIILDYIENNGGWNDPRDKKLCNDITISKINKIILDMDVEF